jgi:hypothetical protein
MAVPPLEHEDIDPRYKPFEEKMKSYQTLLGDSHELGPALPEEGMAALQRWDFYYIGARLLKICDEEPYSSEETKESINFYKKYLQTLALSNSPKSHWVLKDPIYSWHLDDFLEIFPDARVVIIDRNIKETCLSSLNFFTKAEIWWPKLPEKTEIGPHHLKELIKGKKYLEKISSNPKYKKQIFNVAFEDVTKDPDGSAKRIYDFFGLYFSSGMQIDIQTFFATQKVPKSMKNPKTVGQDLLEWGLDSETIEKILKKHGLK